MSNSTKQKVGLQWLDDETLAHLVEVDIDVHGEIKSSEASAAFAELARRTEHAL